MKLAQLVITLLSAAHAVSAPIDQWAAGVTEEGGWKDYNKKFDGRDNEQCWAITAANLIDWWQTQNPAQVPAGAPQGEAILQTFIQSFSNAGSDPDQGLNWWFTGNYQPGREDCAARKENAAGAYLRNTLPQNASLWGSLLTAMRSPHVTAESATKALIQGAQAGAAFWIGVSYVSPKGRPAMHSLNVWGVRHETDASGESRICGIWIADSDDYKTGVTYVPVKTDENMLIFDCPEHPIYGRIPRIVIDTISSLAPKN